MSVRQEPPGARPNAASMPRMGDLRVIPSQQDRGVHDVNRRLHWSPNFAHDGC